jgi:3'-5' exonuclease
MATLLFDIETSYTGRLEGLSEHSLSPATACVSTLGVYDVEEKRGSIYINNDVSSEFQEGKWLVKHRSEPDMLTEFWQGIYHYDTYVGFGTRRFDTPFLIHRSIAHGVSHNTSLRNRRQLARQQMPFHVDLLDEFSFYGDMSKTMSLGELAELYNLADKGGVRKTEQLREQFREKQYHQLVEHCQAKLSVTLQLYDIWKQHLAPASFLNAIHM